MKYIAINVLNRKKGKQNSKTEGKNVPGAIGEQDIRDLQGKWIAMHTSKYQKYWSQISGQFYFFAM